MLHRANCVQLGRITMWYTEIHEHLTSAKDKIIHIALFSVDTFSISRHIKYLKEKK